MKIITCPNCGSKMNEGEPHGASMCRYIGVRLERNAGIIKNGSEGVGSAAPILNKVP